MKSYRPPTAKAGPKVQTFRKHRTKLTISLHQGLSSPVNRLVCASKMPVSNTTTDGRDGLHCVQNKLEEPRQEEEAKGRGEERFVCIARAAARALDCNRSTN